VRQPFSLLNDYSALIVLLCIAGLALILAAIQYLFARARGVTGANVGAYWLRIFPILCLLATAAVWISRWAEGRK
jgi:hypothetical protein